MRRCLAVSRLHEIVENASDLASTTRERYLRDLNQWVDFAGTDSAYWTRKRATEFYKALLGRMRPQSANRLMASIAYASRWWAHFENDPRLDFALVQASKARDKKPQPALDQESARRLLLTCDGSIAGTRDLAIMVVGLETGMRQMSLTGMTIEDTLLTESSRSPYPAALVPLKGKDPAWVPLSDTAVAAMRPWLKVLEDHAAYEGPLFRPLFRRVGRTRTETVPESKALSRSALAKILDAHGKAAGLGHINPHRLRHTFVTWRSNQGLQPHEIAAITHHDITKAYGALGGYINAQVTGGNVRNSTPAWLAELVASKV